MSDPYDTQVGGDHYKKMKIQPSEFINKNEMQFAEGNAIKYICRHGSKGRLQDLEKAKHYIDMIIERDYADEAKNSSVDSGVNITYEGLSVTLPKSDEDSMDDLSEGFKDDLSNDIFYPSGASVGKEGFDE